jgi:hypothetical protein
MHTNNAIQPSVLSLALVACVQTSSHMERSSLVPEQIRSLSAADLTHADAIAWSRLEKVGFNVRHAAARTAYFLDADQIAEMHPHTIADIFRHVPVLLENPFSYRNRMLGPSQCFATYVDGLIRRGKGPSTLDTFIRVKDVIGAEVYPPGQNPPPPFARATADESCTTVAIWTRLPQN